MVQNKLLSAYPLTNEEAVKKSFELTWSDETLTLLTICSIQFFLYNYTTSFSTNQKYVILISCIVGVEFIRNYFNLRLKTKKQIKNQQDQQDQPEITKIDVSPY